MDVLLQSTQALQLGLLQEVIQHAKQDRVKVSDNDRGM